MMGITGLILMYLFTFGWELAQPRAGTVLWIHAYD